MKYLVSLKALLLLALVCLVKAAPRDSIEQILETHNKIREIHHSPKLKWSSVLATTAQRYVLGCDFNKPFQRKNATDNVAVGYDNWNDTIEAWYGSESSYDYSQPGYSNHAGPFITMIWKSATHLGCASKDCGLDLGRIYQCVYSPSIPVELAFTSSVYKKNIKKP